jgi:hypothetical protein
MGLFCALEKRQARANAQARAWFLSAHGPYNM